MRCRTKLMAMPFLVIAVVALFGLVVMLLWNSVMPVLFGSVGPIDYWHAVGLLILCRVLFGGLRGRGGRPGRRHWHKWAAMTPEEREQILRDRSVPF